MDVLLSKQIATFFVLFALGYAIGWFITHLDIKPRSTRRACRNCFWLYNARDSVFCSDPDKPVRYLDRSLINKFHCSRWSLKK